MKKEAIFAGGCFWCLQAEFDETSGVLETFVGYTGGQRPNPSYEKVCLGITGHVEAIFVVFDDQKTSYETLLHVFWKGIDPTRKDGQFCDVGSQYQPVIFYLDKEQEILAKESKKKLEKRFGKVLVEILPAKEFFKAEEYHQKFYKKDPVRYQGYKKASGRKETLKRIWDDE